MITELKLMGPWPEVKEKIKETNIGLSDADLEYEPGREYELIAHLSKKMNRSPEEIRAWIESISGNDSIAS